MVGWPSPAAAAPSGGGMEKTSPGGSRDALAGRGRVQGKEQETSHPGRWKRSGKPRIQRMYNVLPRSPIREATLPPEGTAPLFPPASKGTLFGSERELVPGPSPVYPGGVGTENFPGNSSPRKPPRVDDGRTKRHRHGLLRAPPRLLLPPGVVDGGNGLHGAEVREGSLNPRPIVGIVSQPLGKHTNRSYIAASYVKWIEASGARVAPLIFDRSPQELRANFEAINGIVLPGGDASLTEDSPYFKTLKMLFGWAMEANSRGDYFPLYGACLGLEALAILVSGNHSVLSSTDAEDDPVPLHIATGTAESPFLGFLGEEQMKKATRESIAYENHDKALLLESFHADEKLRETFRLLTVSYDRYGRAYVSSMEGRDAPILALQFHPEKNSYEWNMAEHIPHSLDAVEFSQGVGNYVGKLARKSRHRPITSSQERSMLIYQYPVTYTGSSTKAGVESTFEEEYRFAPAVERTW
eukprot:scaffold44_cov339-Pavlova_lutheri.AAC.28